MRPLRRLAAVALIGAALALAGCASPADKQAMTVAKPVAIAKPHPYSVALTVSGGAGTAGAATAIIANADLKEAIEASIRQTRVFRDVVQGKNGQYELLVNVVTLSMPAFGFSFTVELEAGWTLTRAGDGQVVYRKSIMSTGVAGATEAFVGSTRQRLAVEAAARANITQGLTAIGLLDL